MFPYKFRSVALLLAFLMVFGMGALPVSAANAPAAPAGIPLSAGEAGALSSNFSNNNLTPSPESAAPSGVEPGAYTVTLITGDTLAVVVNGDGTMAVTADPAAMARPVPAFHTVETVEGAHVIPADVMHLVPRVLDARLFNITYLMEYGYHDGARDDIPVIISGSSDRDGINGASLASQLPGFNLTRTFTSIAGVAGVFPKGPGLMNFGGMLADGGTNTLAAAGVEKIWLDAKFTVDLEDSVPHMGAPAVWDAGYDGSGITVAVLDTGIDGQHPDLQGKVTMESNFTDDADASDGHGHGTHVAGIVAGTGAASSGLRQGVAPGAQLINGKVLNSGGTGDFSWVIAGMEWAAANADVVNMSLGGGPTDGTDPVSMALNSLTEEHNVLFVVAAGNSGPSSYTVGNPGAADLALTVGNTDKADNLAVLSSRGPRVGDYAIKPEITATGTDIAAARAEGTALGPIVDEYYTRISGTSMAAPHVAGAAALLLQKEPGAHHQRLKAALASTAVPNPALTVYQQGGGRLHIPRAVFSTVVPDEAALSMGYFPYPHDDAEPVTRTLTYSNDGESDVTLNLAVEVADEEGTIAPPGIVTLSTEQLTVPAGGQASVDITVDVGASEYGLFGGHLEAADADGEISLHTPVGFHKESERYDLTVIGIARDGRPATGISGVDVINVDDQGLFQETGLSFTDGEVTVRVPPGTYAINAFIFTYDEPEVFVNEVTFVAEPEIEIDGDTTVTLDATGATKLQIVTPEETETDTLVLAYFRRDVLGFGYQHSFNIGSVGDQVYTVPTSPISKGEYEFYSAHVMYAPLVRVFSVEPEGLAPAVEYMTDSPLIDGHLEAGLVFAGLGLPEDFDELDVTGKVALIERGELPFAEKAKNAAAAGAAVAIIHNNEPGSFSGTLQGEGVIPTFQLSMEEGLELRALLDVMEVTLAFEGAPVSPFMYDLVLPEPGGIGGELIYVVGENAPVSTLETHYHSDVADKEQLMVRHSWRPHSNFSFGFGRNIEGPLTRNEYVTAGDTRFQQHTYYERPFTAGHFEPVDTYEATLETVTWWKQAVRPGFLEGSPWQAPLENYRSGDTLYLRIAETADGSHDHWGWNEPGADGEEFRLYRNGELVATDHRAYGEYPMVPEDAQYRLELDWSRNLDGWLTSTETKTSWVFQSGGSPDHELIPLLVVEFDLPVDEFNRLTTTEIGFNVRHQKGSDTAPIGGAELRASFDDGSTWHEVEVAGDGSGYFTAVLPDAGGEAEYVSLHVAAWDEQGSGIKQEITRAAAWVQAGPQLTVTEPEEGTHTNDDTITVAGTAVDSGGGAVTVIVNGEKADVQPDGSFEIRILLPEEDGPFAITVIATDEGGNSVTETRNVVVDRTPPVITGVLPDEDVELEWGDELTISFTSESGLDAAYQVFIMGTGDDDLPGVPMAEIGTTGVYEGTYTAPDGAAFTGAEIEVYAMDKAGNIAQLTAAGTVSVVPPEDEPVEPPTLVIAEPADGFLTNRDAVRVSGTATDDQEGQEVEQVTVNGREVAVAGDGTFTTRIILWEGDNVITVTATNTAGKTATETVTVEADWTAPELTNLEPAADITLEWGETYTFRFESESGLNAAYQIVVGGRHGTWVTRDIPIKGTPMTETSPGSGVYEATYTAPAGVLLENAIVQFNAADEAGNVIMTTAPGELTVVEGD